MRTKKAAKQENTMKTILAETVTGTQRLAGTDWPILTVAQRVVSKGRVRWVLVKDLCNGVPERAEEYPTRGQLLEAFEGSR